MLVKPKGIFRQFNDSVVDWLEDDPEHILMEYSDESFDHYPEIQKVNVKTGRDRVVKRSVPGIEHWMTDTNGTPRIGRGTQENGREKMVIFNPANKKWENSKTYAGLEPDAPIFGILNNGREIVIGDYKNQDTLGLYVYDLEKKQVTRKVFHDDSYDASGVVFSKDGETIIGAKYTAESDKTVLLGENGTLLDRIRARFPEHDVGFVDQTQDKKTVLVSMSSPYDPGGLYIYEDGDDLPRRLSAMYRGFTAKDTGNVTAATYSARDGQKIPAFITFPRLFRLRQISRIYPL